MKRVTSNHCWHQCCTPEVCSQHIGLQQHIPDAAPAGGASKAGWKGLLITEMTNYLQSILAKQINPDPEYMLAAVYTLLLLHSPLLHVHAIACADGSQHFMHCQGRRRAQTARLKPPPLLTSMSWSALNFCVCFRGTKLMSAGGSASYVKGPRHLPRS